MSCHDVPLVHAIVIDMAIGGILCIQCIDRTFYKMSMVTRLPCHATVTGAWSACNGPRLGGNYCCATNYYLAPVVTRMSRSITAAAADQHVLVAAAAAAAAAH